VPDEDQTDEDAEEHGVKYVCPVCGTNGALVEEFNEGED
jgi:hypothetical protein